jgi:hypothetical protein
MEAVLQVFSFLSKHGRSKLVFDPITRDWSNRDWTHPDWKDFYPGAVEQLPHDMLIPLGKPIHMNIFCDESHASDLVTRCSTTGFLIYLCGTPVVWYSRRYNMVKPSTFGSECVALRIASDKVRLVKLLPLPQLSLRARTDARTNPSAQRATQLRSVLARVYAVSRQNQINTTVP